MTRGTVARPAAGQPDGPAAKPSVVVAEDGSKQTALDTLASIHQTLQGLSATRQSEFSAIGAQLVAAAKQIAREALGSESSLIDERVTHFADVLLRQIHPTQPAVFYVNPECISALKNWLEQSEGGELEIQADATVPPGDCRIELDDKGFLASLESFLDAAGKRTSLLKGEI